MYALIQDAAIREYPYSVAQLRNDNPQTSFPVEMPNAALAEWGVYPVMPAPQPECNPRTHKVEESTPAKQAGAWVQVWGVVPLTAEEIAAQTSEQEDAVRFERDARLMHSDWTQLPDSPLSTEQRSAWTAYRQALRDIPSQAGFPFDVSWPAQP